MTTLDSIRELASLLHSIRASWDITATCNALLPHRDMPLETLAAAAIRCALDQNNRTPAALGWMTLASAKSAESEGATQKSKEPTCYICGATRSNCQQLHDFEVRHGLADPHIFETHEEADANTGKQPRNFDPTQLALAAMPKVNDYEDSPERIAAKARARAAAEAARQKSKWKPAPPPDERRIQEPEPEETPAT